MRECLLCLEMLIFEFPGIAHMYQVIGGLARRCSEHLSSRIPSGPLTVRASEDGSAASHRVALQKST